MRSNIFLKPIRISRSSHSATRQLRPNCAFRRRFPDRPPPGGAADFRFPRKPVSSSRRRRRRRRRPRASRQEADKRGQGEGSTRLDYFYTRHADLLGADLEPRSSLALRLPLSESRLRDLFFDFSRNFILDRERRIQRLCIFLLLVSF